MIDNFGATGGPPWGWQPSLRAMAGRAGIDFDELVAKIKEGAAADSIAASFGVSEETARQLVDHFMKYGIDSVVGQQ